MNDNERRRLYNDQVQERNRLERQARIRNGTEPSRTAKVKRIAEAVVTGVLLGEAWDAFTN